MLSLLKKKSKIYLLIKNVKIRKKNKKLNYTKFGLVFINIRKKTISYKLNLCKNAKVYLIFHILLMKLSDSKTLIQNIFY